MVLFLCLNVSLDRKIKVVPLSHISVLWSCPEGSMTDEVKNTTQKTELQSLRRFLFFLQLHR